VESTLAVAYQDLSGDVGHYLGYGRGAANNDLAWNSIQQGNIDRCLKGGLRKVYHCGYDWSFLKPVAQLSLLSGQDTLPLPDDFGGIEGDLIIVDPSRVSWRIPITGDVRYRHGLAPQTTGQPLFAEIEPLKGTQPIAGQRLQVRVWPIADADYLLQCRYYLNPNYLSGAFPYVYGGAEHAETYLEACLSVAEILLDDSSGVHAQQFAALLEISKDLDRRKKPQTLGYCGDRSDLYDRRWGRRGWNRINEPVISFGGAVYP
jgi:hypothetical protein